MKKVFFSLIFFFLTVALFAGDLLINEFIVTPTSSEAIEIKNVSANPIVLSNYTITVAPKDDMITFPNDTLAPDSFFVLNSTNVSSWPGLSNSGSILILKDSSGSVEDSVGYGSYGGAPAPIYKFSAARVDTTGDNAVDFNMDPTPTMGSANDAPANALGTGNVYINEVYPDSVNGKADQFIELKNFGSASEDISGYVIYAHSNYSIPSGTIIDANGLFFLPDSSFSQYMYLSYKYGNVYLMNSNGERVDQMGYSAYHPDTSYGVWGDTTSTRTVFTGYDLTTSSDFHFMNPTPDAQNQTQTGIISSLVKSQYSAIRVSNGISNGNITVFYTIKKSAPVSIKVFDLAGNCVKTLVPTVTKAAGLYGVNWKTQRANGLYLIRAKIGNKTFARKVLLNR